MYGLFDTLEAAETPVRAGLPGPHAKAGGGIVAAGADNEAPRDATAAICARLDGVGAEIAAIDRVLRAFAALLLAIAARVYGVV